MSINIKENLIKTYGGEVVSFQDTKNPKIIRTFNLNNRKNIPIVLKMGTAKIIEKNMDGKLVQGDKRWKKVETPKGMKDKVLGIKNKAEAKIDTKAKAEAKK